MRIGSGSPKTPAEDAGGDLSSLGFHLDVLKIQNVSDERGYLEAIGREKAAAAKVAAQRALATQRVSRGQERLRANVIEPAKAERGAAQARAEAQAAPILETGTASETPRISGFEERSRP